MNKVTISDLSGLFESVGRVMSENAELLGDMDAKMGDGDLGLTMKKGFTALAPLLAEMDEADLGKRLSRLGMKMSSIVPSTMGTLMASGILSGGKAVVGRTELDSAGFADYLQGFADGIVKRGKCAPGDRTVLDAIAPAAEAAQALLKENPAASLEAVAKAALSAAQAGVEATKTMRPKYGKAAVFSDRAIGVADQGACAGCFMIEGYCDYICG